MSGSQSDLTDDDVTAVSNPQRWAATKEDLEFFPGTTSEEEDLLTPTQKLQNAAHQRLLAQARESYDGDDEDDEPGEDDDAPGDG